MDIPIKFIIGWLLIVSVTYSVSGWVYNETYGDITPMTPVNVGNDINFLNTLGYLWNGVVWLINSIISVLSVMFFALPDVPWQITAVLNVFFIPLNIVWFIGIYPYIRDFLRLIVEGIKAVGEIIPF